MLFRENEREIKISDIKKWLDSHIVEDTTNKKVEDDGKIFEIEIKLFGTSMKLVKEWREGPIQIVDEFKLPPSFLRVYRDLPEMMRREFLNRVESVLAASLGIYFFIDKDSNEVHPENLEGIEVRHYMYPDVANQHHLMNSILRIAWQINYVKGICDNFVEQRQYELEQ